MRPSIPGSEKSGAGERIASVGCSWAGANADTARSTTLARRAVVRCIVGTDRQIYNLTFADIGIRRIHRLYESGADGQATKQSVRSERFAGLDQSCEAGRTTWVANSYAVNPVTTSLYSMLDDGVNSPSSLGLVHEESQPVVVPITQNPNTRRP